MRRRLRFTLMSVLFSFSALAQQLPDKDATFPGGEVAWRKYLTKNLKPNIPLKHKTPPGIYSVIIKFTVDTTGLLTDFISETNHGYGMEEEVIRVLKAGERWIPAEQGGVLVKAFRVQPVTFVVPEKGKKSERNKRNSNL